MINKFVITPYILPFFAEVALWMFFDVIGWSIGKVGVTLSDVMNLVVMPSYEENHYYNLIMISKILSSYNFFLLYDQI